MLERKKFSNTQATEVMMVPLLVGESPKRFRSVGDYLKDARFCLESCIEDPKGKILKLLETGRRQYGKATLPSCFLQYALSSNSVLQFAENQNSAISLDSRSTNKDGDSKSLF